ncbi:MAG: hypothetical protein PHP44_06945 [Kiritimatiellae bacterium]|nr:hypothetical protein [Kiritimatiellia bacterium]
MKSWNARNNGRARAVLACLLLGVFCTVGTAQLPRGEDELARLRQLNSLDAVEKRDIRDPFWPVGFYPEWWRKPVSAAGSGEEAARPDQWAQARSLVKISGMSKMGTSGYFAVVNGRTVSEGDAVSVTLKGKVYRWMVTEIGERGLKLTPLEEE